jgi:hypothetical protein
MQNLITITRHAGEELQGQVTGRTRALFGCRGADLRIQSINSIEAIANMVQVCVRESFLGPGRVRPLWGVDVQEPGATRKRRALARQRTSKPLRPSGSSTRTSTAVTRAAGGPWRHHSASLSSASGSPSATISTRPSARLRAQPETPSAPACSAQLPRYQTPWTLPMTQRCRRAISPKVSRSAVGGLQLPSRQVAFWNATSSLQFGS